MKRKYVIKRFLFGLVAILISAAMIWIDYLVVDDQLPTGFLLMTIPVLLILARISKDMDILSAFIELAKKLEKDEL